MIADIERFQRMVRAVSKQSKLKYFLTSSLNIPAGWEKVLLNQTFGKRFKTVTFSLYDQHMIIHNDEDRKLLNDKPDFTVEIFTENDEE
uniref:Uncharacterized protein n=1 Tax=Panagrolaimus sp. JU765 TaxID=591449 RepID=A0AC34RCR0_9BILA